MDELPVVALGHQDLEAVEPRTRRRVLAGFGLAVAVSYAATFTKLDYGPLREGIGKPESVELFDHVRRDTPSDAVVVFLKPRAMALLTGRRSTVWHEPKTDAELQDYWRSIGATHVVAAQRNEPFLDSEQDRLVTFTRDYVARSVRALAPHVVIPPPHDDFFRPLDSAMGFSFNVRFDRFVDEAGATVIFQGVNIEDPDDLELEGHWNRGLFEAIASWNANIVRVPVHPPRLACR